MSLTSKFAILEAHPEYAVPTVVRKQTYMTVVAEPVLETIMEVLVASKPTENVPGAVCAAVEQICRGMASSLGDLSVDGQAILAYCVKYVDPVLRPLVAALYADEPDDIATYIFKHYRIPIPSSLPKIPKTVPKPVAQAPSPVVVPESKPVPQPTPKPIEESKVIDKVEESKTTQPLPSPKTKGPRALKVPTEPPPPVALGQLFQKGVLLNGIYVVATVRGLSTGGVSFEVYDPVTCASASVDISPSDILAKQVHAGNPSAIKDVMKNVRVTSNTTKAILTVTLTGGK